MDYQKINKLNIGKWEKALEYLTQELSKNDIPYYLSASGLHYILGEDVYPYDIDLFVSKEDITKAFSLFNEYKTSDVHKWEERYLEFQGIYNDIPFEICEWEEEPKKLEIFRFKDLDIRINEKAIS